MPAHRPVPGIAQQRQGFSRDTLPPIQSPLSFPMPSPIDQPTPEAALAEQLQDLALEIYCRLAIEHIQVTPEADRDYSRVAQEAQQAARAYFEQMGVQFQ